MRNFCLCVLLNALLKYTHTLAGKLGFAFDKLALCTIHSIESYIYGYACVCVCVQLTPAASGLDNPLGADIQKPQLSPAVSAAAVAVCRNWLFAINFNNCLAHITHTPRAPPETLSGEGIVKMLWTFSVTSSLSKMQHANFVTVARTSSDPPP